MADDPVLTARARAMASRFADFDSGRKARHATAAGKALARIAAPDPELEILVLAAEIEAEGALGHGVPEALAARVRAIETTTDPGVHAFVGSSVMAYVLCAAAEFERARPWFAAMLPWTADHAPSRYPRRLGHLVRAEIGSDRWQSAERLIGEQLDWAEQLEQPVVRRWALALRAALEARRGRQAEGRALATEALAGAEAAGDEHGIADALAPLGLLELGAGRPELAVEPLLRLDALSVALHVCEPAFQLYRADLVEALVGAGRLDVADGAIARFEREAATAGRAWGLATSARARAVVAAAHGDMDTAAAAVDRALGHHERLPMAFERARTLLVAGQVQRRRRAKGLADVALREAAEIFGSLGAASWAARAESERSRVGLRPRAPATLTPTEREIAGLVAAGYTNREIAERAFLAEKSVEKNLTRIYHKLGVRSRTALVGHLARQDPAAPTD